MPSNNSLLDTNLNISPYSDDFDPKKQYYKILFKPSTAVQVRELNQLQTILQNQITSFGQNIYKEGSVIKGCSFTFDNNLNYVKLRDTYANGTSLTVSDLDGLIVTNPRGLKALIINTLPGLVSQNPNLNTIYLKYIDSNNAVYANGQPQKNFDSNEELYFQTEAGTPQGNVLVANVANAYGKAYSMNVTEGIIFKKGYFIYVTDQSKIVERYSNVPDNVSVGFEAGEEIITANADETLLDNSAGSPNYTAPGADRLKLTPQLVVRPTVDVSNSTTFFSLVDFKNGLPVTIRNDEQFNSVGREVARRTFETNGNFVVNPFIVTSNPLANTSDPEYSSHFNAVVSKGLGYVEGYRVEFLNNNTKKVRRGIDFDSLSQQSVSINYGYYVILNEMSGSFGDSSSIIKVELHNVVKTSITSSTLLSTGYSSSTKIGTAYVKGFEYDSGTPGTATGQYRLYLFNIAMNPGSNFSDVKSVINYTTNIIGVGDVVTTFNAASNSNVATIFNSSLNTLLYSYGQKAIKPNGFSEQEFIYTRSSNTQILVTGNASIILPAVSGQGSETFEYLGNLSTSQMSNIIVTPAANGFSSNKPGTVQVFAASANVQGSATQFLTDYRVGDYIKIQNVLNPKKIVSISNNIFMLTESNNSNHTGMQHQKAFIAGNPIPFDSTRSNRTMSISSNTLNISLGETANAAFNVKVDYNVKRSDTTSIKKIINKTVFVKIDCSNASTGAVGPWSLGLPDVYKLNGVYINTSGNKTYTNTSFNYVSDFLLDNGQKDTHYDIAHIHAATTNIANQLNPNTTILVSLQCFTYDTSQGKGFFDASSYPIDDANTANTNAITTSQIPSYTSDSGSFYDLRDVVDFRPYASNTAAVANTIAGATVNPTSTLTFNYTPYLPAPNKIFQTNLEYYIGRVDRLALDIDGNIVITEGLPDVNNPAAPLERSGTMTLALIKIPPYPSLTTREAKLFGRYDIAIETQATQNRRYTMKDIAGFDKRITNLEYYTSLSLLESAASTLQVRNSDTGQNRFQNGIFVDPFNGFDLSNTKHPKFYIAIDSARTEIRPSFLQLRSDFTFDPVLSTNVQKHGDLVMLPHTSNNVFIQQGYASKFRNCIEGNVYNWKGTIILTPGGTLSPDITTSPDVVNNIDLAQNWINLQNAWGTQWGNWETLSTEYANTLITASQTISQRIGGPAPAQGGDSSGWGATGVGDAGVGDGASSGDSGSSSGGSSSGSGSGGDSGW